MKQKSKKRKINRNYNDSTFHRIYAVPMSVICWSSVRDGAPGICES